MLQGGSDVIYCLMYLLCIYLGCLCFRNQWDICKLCVRVVGTTVCMDLHVHYIDTAVSVPVCNTLSEGYFCILLFSVFFKAISLFFSHQ